MLCGCHFLATSLVGWTVKRFTEPAEGSGDAKGGKAGEPAPGPQLPLALLAFFVLVADTSIVGMNFSLLLNSVGFYQISKLAMIPTTALFEFLYQGRQFSNSLLACIFVVLFGVGMATVTDVHFNAAGALAAFIGLLSTAGQQVMINQLQVHYKVSASTLISRTAPAQAISLMALGPFVDMLITGGDKVWEYEFHVPSVTLLVISCGFAGLVNLSQFMCIGRFSAVSFQVLGHIKTVLVLGLGFYLFDAVITMRNLAGIGFALCGMVAYGRVSLQENAGGR